MSSLLFVVAARRLSTMRAVEDRRRVVDAEAAAGLELRIAADLARLEAERAGDAEDARRRALVALALHRLVLLGEVVEVLRPTDTGGTDDGGLRRSGALPGCIGRRAPLEGVQRRLHRGHVGHGDDDEAGGPVQRARAVGGYRVRRGRGCCWRGGDGQRLRGEGREQQRSAEDRAKHDTEPFAQNVSNRCWGSGYV